MRAAAMRAAAKRLMREDGAQDTDAARRAGQQQWAPGHQLSSLSRHSTALISSPQGAPPQGWQSPSSNAPFGRTCGCGFRHSKRRLSSAAADVTFSSCFQVTLPSKAPCPARRLGEGYWKQGASSRLPHLVCRLGPGDDGLMLLRTHHLAQRRPWLSPVTLRCSLPQQRQLPVRRHQVFIKYKARMMRACSVAGGIDTVRKATKALCGMI